MWVLCQHTGGGEGLVRAWSTCKEGLVTKSIRGRGGTVRLPVAHTTQQQAGQRVASLTSHLCHVPFWDLSGSKPQTLETQPFGNQPQEPRGQSPLP